LRYVEGIFSKGFRDERSVLDCLIQAIQLGDIAYDIGANIGTHTIFMAKKVGRHGNVIAFEPNIQNYERLQLNIILNGLKNVDLKQIALGHVFREGMLYNKGVCSSLVASQKDSVGHKVKIEPGDHFVRSENLPLPKVVKIDVEGYEYAVIRGLRETLNNKICQMVCCEIHPVILPKGITPDDVIHLLKSLGFNRIETYPRGEIIHAFC